MKKISFTDFVSKLLIDTKDSFFFYKNFKYNLKSIIQKKNWPKLINDESLLNYFIESRFKNFHLIENKLTKSYLDEKFKNKKNFKLKLSFKNIFILFFYNQFYINLFYFFQKDLFKKKNSKKYFFCFVSETKHLNHIDKIIKKINCECIFIVSSIIHRKRLNLKRHNSIILPPVNIFNTSIVYDQNAVIKFYIKSISKLMGNLKPKFILTTEGDHPIAETLAKVAKNYNIKSICLQWGVAPIKTPQISFMNMSYDYYVSWGSLFSRILKPYNSKTKFLEFGNIHFLKRKKKLNKVLFLMQPIDQHSSKPNLKALFILASNLSKKFKKWKFVVREHPNLSIKNLFNHQIILKNKNLIIEKYIEKSIYASLSETKITVGISSSALLESLYYRSIPCVLRPYNSFKYYPDFKKEGIGLIENNIKKLELQIVKLIREKKKLNNLNKKIYLKNKIMFSNKNGTYSKNKIINLCNKLGKN